jgi:hypothetical protein
MRIELNELTPQEIDSVVGAVGGWAFGNVALNPQPIPSGRGDLGFSDPCT